MRGVSLLYGDQNTHKLFATNDYMFFACFSDQLLSTAILNTPKSTQGPLFGGGIDLDQSLHHIDACIKSPLDFGSPQIE